MVSFTFFFFDWKYSFWANFSPKKTKLSVYAEILYLENFEDGEFNGAAYFFRFRLEVPFLSKFGPKVKTVCLS